MVRLSTSFDAQIHLFSYGLGHVLESSHLEEDATLKALHSQLGLHYQEK